MKEVDLFSEGTVIFDIFNLNEFSCINALIVFSSKFGFWNILFHSIFLLVQQACQ